MLTKLSLNKEFLKTTEKERKTEKYEKNQMANMYFKICSATLAIRKIQI